MDYDHLAMKQNDAMYLAWFRILEKNSPEELAATLASKHRSGKVVETKYLSRGSYNHCYRMKFEEGPDAVVRFPARDKVSFPKEKVDIEVSIMKYVCHNTSIPIPQVLGTGNCAVGPYIVMVLVLEKETRTGGGNQNWRRGPELEEGTRTGMTSLFYPW